jgi:Bax protein
MTTIYASGLPQSYYKIKSVKKQKEVFFGTLIPMIQKQNKIILDDRGFIIKFFDNRQTMETNNTHISRLKKLQKYYKIKALYNKNEYLHKINTIPTSIILAQAALESGWGKSRFVKEGNNIFGHWTYGKKGLIPRRRNKGARHKIRIFDSLEQSLEAYMQNVNSNGAYKKVRALRALAIKKGKKVDGLDIYKGYIYYSELRGEYLRRLKNMITYNKLLKYDKEDYEQK